ncbi:MAG: MgtC/SapB family protein [Planctomycetota bacterium]|jgi:putative Mg2+ transporter-C (MgtC) family protein
MLDLFSAEFIEILQRLLLAAFLGGLVGLERDVHGRAAGLRTHLLVGLGSCLFMILSKIVAESGTGVTDPGRIAAQIVTGIGFLGAGAIMKEGFTVRGLTTAACFWVVAAIGMASGAGEYLLALATSLIALISLSFLHNIDKVYRRDSYRTLSVNVSTKTDTDKIIDIIKRKHISILFVDIENDYAEDVKTVTLSLRLFHRGTTDKLSHDIIEELENADISLKNISWLHGKAF